MSAIAAIFCRDGGAPAPEGIAELSGALHRFGTRSVESAVGAAGLVRRIPACFTPEDGSDAGIGRIGDGSRILFDGSLQYRGDLIAALGLDRREARGLADADLFARAWQRWEREAALRVEGEFAAVVWDPGRRVLTALCSPLRPPPLFFHVTERRAIVATVPRAIFAWGDLPRRLDDVRVAEGMAFGHSEPRSTYWRNVQSVLPGEVLTVTPDAHRIRRYYDLAERGAPVRLPKDSDYVEAAGELVRRAVGSALRASETPSLLLSGGLDSPTIAVVALDLLTGHAGAAPLLSFTAVPSPEWDGRVHGGRIGDEAPLVHRLQEKEPALDARFVAATGLDADAVLMRMNEYAEVPVNSPGNQHWLHECRRLSRAAGRRTMLTGASGNATLSYTGFPRFASLLRTGRLPTLWREAALWPRQQHSLARSVIRPFLPPRPGRVFGRGNDLRTLCPRSPIHPEFARHTRLAERIRAAGSGPYFRGARSCREGQIRMSCNPHRLGTGRSTRLALRTIHDVADRDPLGDRRLVEWCLGLPEEQYLHRGVSRRLIRRCMAGRLPAEILAGIPGRQGADWHLRLGRNLPHIRDTFDGWRSDPEVAGRIDLDRLLRVLDTWPARTPLSSADHPDYRLAQYGIDGALATGHFIRWAHGRSGRA